MTIEGWLIEWTVGGWLIERTLGGGNSSVNRFIRRYDRSDALIRLNRSYERLDTDTVTGLACIHERLEWYMHTRV